MITFGSATREEVYKAAKAAEQALQRTGISCCLVGGAACSLYGLSRTPTDVDMVVLTYLDQETVKQEIVDTDSTFFLVPSANPRNRYKVLWFALSPRTSYLGRPSRACKVDVLVPETSDMQIPRPPPSTICFANGLPLMSIVGLILLKLQGWIDHKNHYRADMRMKQHVDVRDLEEMLAIAAARKATVESETWLPASFVSKSKSRVAMFVLYFPQTVGRWRALGL